MSQSDKEPSAENQQERLLSTTEELNWYISGFVDGEGSFNISLRKKSDYLIGWQPVLSFNVSQRDITVLRLIQKRLGGGIIKCRKDGIHSYDATNPRFLFEVVVPFFEKYHFFSIIKKVNFALFTQAVKLMVEKKHLEKSGFKQLLMIREKLNIGKGRKRKYQLEDVLGESSETTC